MNQSFSAYGGVKCTYSAPDCKVVYLHLEKNLLQSASPGAWGEDPDEIGG